MPIVIIFAFMSSEVLKETNVLNENNFRAGQTLDAGQPDVVCIFAPPDRDTEAAAEFSRDCSRRTQDVMPDEASMLASEHPRGSAWDSMLQTQVRVHRAEVSPWNRRKEDV